MLVQLILRMSLVALIYVRLCFLSGVETLDKVIAVIASFVAPYFVNSTHQSLRCSKIA